MVGAAGTKKKKKKNRGGGRGDANFRRNISDPSGAAALPDQGVIYKLL